MEECLRISCTIIEVYDHYPNSHNLSSSLKLLIYYSIQFAIAHPNREYLLISLVLVIIYEFFWVYSWVVKDYEQVFRFLSVPFWWDHWSNQPKIESRVHLRADFAISVSVFLKVCFGKAYHLKVWVCLTLSYSHLLLVRKGDWLPLSFFLCFC